MAPLNAEILGKLHAAFRPHAPIDNPDDFQGRESERERVETALITPGLHVVIFGERGAGKTSLANVATSKKNPIKVFCERGSSFSALCRSVLLKLSVNDPARLIYDARTQTIRSGGINLDLNSPTLSADDFRTLLPSGPTFIVVDEIDRIENIEVVHRLAELCKNLSTNRPDIKFVLIGVASTADEILRGHTSNVRNFRQIALERMTEAELSKIIAHGELVLGLQFDGIVKKRLVQVSDRLPYYVHLIAVSTAERALARGSQRVEVTDFELGLKAAARDCDAELSTTYEAAIPSVRESEIYRRIVWAVAEGDARVSPTAAITAKVNAIAKGEEDEPVTAQAVGAALKKLIKPERKQILTKEQNGLYRFSNPLMRGYVRLVRESR
ncbi:AAA family ATPase [Archangium violaceum]|uniref:AAA family ATPase n=1 Tax=Archangium violaceum TaxID=83451 RepID=UPI0036DAC758